LTQLRKLLVSLTIVGVGSASFESTLDGIRAIHDYARTTANPSTTLDEYQPDQWHGYPAISFTNTVFSPRPSGFDIASVPFTKGEDPDGRLVAVMNANQELCHLREENKIFYVEMKNDGAEP
jgi:hypothetical protein